MNKNFKVIKINGGFQGILLTAFLVFGIVSGFIISPSWVCMKIWNFIALNNSFASINLYQGLLLWFIIVLTLFALNKKNSFIGFGSYKKLSPEQIREIIEKSKASNSKFMNGEELFQTLNAGKTFQSEENKENKEQNQQEAE